MKKIFTLIAAFSTAFAFAGTPTIDGVYNSGEGWGTAVATGDAVAGWSNANAKRLYVTYDNSYVYFAAECSAESWQQFIFVVNTQSGGSSTDSWGRQITYNHTNKPDFLFRGDIAGSNYAEYHVWNGTTWTGTGTNVNAGGTEVKGIFSNTAPYNGFIEIRVPRSTIGFGVLCDVQFVIGGNNNDHGCFDAIPNDNNSTGWNPPQSSTTISNYVSNVVMPASLSYFRGNVLNNSASLSWLSNVETNFEKYIVEQSTDGKNWNAVSNISSKGNNSIYNTQTTINQNTFYRLKMIAKDGSFVYSNVLLLKKYGKKIVELISNPVKDVVKLNINSTNAGSYLIDVFTTDGKKVYSTNYIHPGNGITTVDFTAPTVKGLYYIRISNEGNAVETLKLKVD